MKRISKLLNKHFLNIKIDCVDITDFLETNTVVTFLSLLLVLLYHTRTLLQLASHPPPTPAPLTCKIRGNATGFKRRDFNKTT